MSQQSEAFENVPVIDLSDGDESFLIETVAQACSTAGFFQIVNHGIPEDLMQEFRAQCRAYFTQLPQPVKDRQRRHDTNARGYFDDELTKQRLDWKQALDVGVPGSRDWNLPDDDPRNACLDGFNQFPSETELPGFRSTVVRYFDACAELSHRIAKLIQAGIVGNEAEDEEVHECNDDEDYDDDTGVHIVQDLRRHHTSYLRMNYYPIYSTPEDAASAKGVNLKEDPSPLGISPHRDAGFLTVLLQDDNCHSLQVYHPETDSWHLITPVPGAVTINTGDMAQIWSNGRYRAPLHRVLTHPSSVRYSAPFFYNPGYSSYLRPVRILSDTKLAEAAAATSTTTPRYHPCLWGYFRAVRFAGDLTDLGVEIQVDDFEIVAPSDDGDDDDHERQASSSQKHLTRQARFADLARYDQPFSVEAFRDLLTG